MFMASHGEEQHPHSTIEPPKLPQETNQHPATDEEPTSNGAPISANQQPEAHSSHSTIEDAPVHGAPVHDAPVHDAPVHDAPVHDAPVHDAPVPAPDLAGARTTHAIVEDTPVHDAPPLEQGLISEASTLDTTSAVNPNQSKEPSEAPVATGDNPLNDATASNTEHDAPPTAAIPTIAPTIEEQTIQQQEPITSHVADVPLIDEPPPPAEHDPTPVHDIPDSASTAPSTISNPALEVDSTFSSDRESDGDSAITDVHGLGSTQSARSSIYEFVEEHGRTFHKYKEGKYALPNDATEQDRLDLQHHLLKILLEGRLHLAPIGRSPHNVLDIGTGTGIWAIEFATKNPSASVIGSDLSPIQPDFVPPNCQFEIDDAEDEWMYTRRFDFIHMRGMMTCFSDPRSVLEKAYNQLEPGGYLEMQDGIFPMQCRDETLTGTALDEWGKACVEAGEKIGRPWTNTPRYKGWMQEIGFEDVKEKIFEVPTSTWPKGAKAKEVGMWFQADMLDALGATMVLLTKALGWSPERCELLFVDVRRDLRNRGVHAYMPVYIVWGRKPILKPE